VLRALAALFGLALIAGAVLFGIAWSHRGAHEASIDKAIKNFREHHGASTPGLLRPLSGVYTFVGTGTEHLSLLSTSQHWGPRIPVTVTQENDGCWTFRVDYSTNHWQSTRYCPKGTVLRETGEETYQSFDFVALSVSDLNDVTCNPPIDRLRIAAKPGATWQVACEGRSKSRGTRFHARGSDSFVGVEQVRVGRELVPAYRYHVDRALTGSQSGYERYDIWYSVLDGLPIRTTRSVRVKSPSPIGTVTYKESGEYVISSLTPQR